jgi:predicted RNase H-like HicB family nuclease
MAQLGLEIVIYREDGGFVAQCLNVDVSSDGATADEAREHLREALELFFDEPEFESEFQAVSEAQVQHLTLKSA